MSGTNGNGDNWAALFAAFHDRHRDQDNRKLKYTSVFNTAMEALMAEPDLPTEWRCLAFSWRYSWGNNSDFCIDKIGGTRIGQKECSAMLGLSKQRISDSFLFLKELYYIEPDGGQAIFPIDDPVKRRSKSPVPSGLSDTRITQFQAWCEDWKVRYPADFQELESAEAHYTRLKKVRWEMYRQSVRQADREERKIRREGGQPYPMPVTNIQPYIQQEGGRAGGVSVAAPPAPEPVQQEPPARPPTPVPIKVPETVPEEHNLLMDALHERGLPADDQLGAQLQAELRHTPHLHFLRVLDQRMKRGTIGTGLLMTVAADACKSYVRRPPPPAPSPPVEPACKLCGDSGWLGSTGGDLRPCTCTKEP